MEVTVHEAKTQLSRLLKLAEDGETVTMRFGPIPAAISSPADDQLLRRLGHLQKLAPVKSGIPQHPLVLLHRVCVAGRRGPMI